MVEDFVHVFVNMSEFCIVYIYIYIQINGEFISQKRDSTLNKKNVLQIEFVQEIIIFCFIVYSENGYQGGKGWLEMTHFGGNLLGHKNIYAHC